MNNFDLDKKNDDVFTTPTKKRKEIVIDAPIKNKIIFHTPTKKINNCEDNPLLLAPKKKRNE
jgi:hypothetical protein